MSATTDKNHWENIYSTKASTEVSWFQQYPKTSMEFIKLFQLHKNSSIIDIGGGDSSFIDVLLKEGYTDVTVLDISANAIERAKKRLGQEANKVKWIVSDILEFQLEQKYDFWHDRAAFHFLTTNDKTSKYVSTAKEGISKNGILVLGTFSMNGPQKCSGLDIQQYSEQSMSDVFNEGFIRIKCIEEDHQTPFNTIQNFMFCSFKRM